MVLKKELRRLYEASSSIATDVIGDCRLMRLRTGPVLSVDRHGGENSIRFDGHKAKVAMLSPFLVVCAGCGEAAARVSACTAQK